MSNDHPSAGDVCYRLVLKSDYYCLLKDAVLVKIQLIDTRAWEPTSRTLGIPEFA